MNYPRWWPQWAPESWVGWLNFLVLQWLFLRLCGEYNYQPQLSPDGRLPFLLWPDGFSLFFPVTPLTGWFAGWIPTFWPRHRWVLQLKDPRP
jgi:hypothetical protein